ncbi:L-rhamnose mutarotase [Actinobacillus porcinus]|uniref:L-rhamnose mutarotase n=1 Tax=Actinobacillus porcinus TaxID=51048 RepID=UPI002357A18B|nr:L-rhamnose mutarotase [Actinobacillus porcinus]
MIRKAFVMQVNPDCHAEYKNRHDAIFPELVEELKSHGSHHYSIFLDKERNLLFGYVEIEDEARWNAIAQTVACQKWWAFMKDIMPSNPDNSPISQALEQVFYLE